MQKEIWKDIPDYEGKYQVSNLGRVKSLNRNIYDKNGNLHYIQKEKILKLTSNKLGYYYVNLYNNIKVKNVKVHILVALTFLNHKTDGTTKIVIDHINNISSDNRVENLQIITQRENCLKDKKNKTSKYQGVCWDKKNKKWRTSIRFKGNKINIGLFITEEEANTAYKNKLKELNI
jgi:hypothetical protein